MEALQLTTDYEVKATDMTGVRGMAMGEGLFLKAGVKKAAGDVDLYFWGEWVEGTTLTSTHTPGYMTIKSPEIGGFVLKGSSLCPATKINDPCGTPHEANVEFVVSEIPEVTLALDNGYQLVAVKWRDDVEGPLQVLVDYGNSFFSDDNKVCA